MQLISENRTEATYDEIIDEMISNAWYSVLEFHIHLSGIWSDGGPKDNLEKAVLKLRDLSGLPANATKVEIKNVIKQFDKQLHAEKQALSAGIGELFVIRVAGNVMDNHQLGSVEYAAGHLGTKLVVVLGHSHCGAVGAALHQEPEGYTKFITDEIRKAIGGEKDEYRACCLNVERSVSIIKESLPLDKQHKGEEQQHNAKLHRAQEYVPCVRTHAQHPAQNQFKLQTNHPGLILKSGAQSFKATRLAALP